MKEHLVNYISYINNILVKVKLMELIELKVGEMWERGAEGGSVAMRCPACGLLGVVLDAPTPLIRRLGRMHEVESIDSHFLGNYPSCTHENILLPSKISLIDIYCLSLLGTEDITELISSSEMYRLLTIQF